MLGSSLDSSVMEKKVQYLGLSAVLHMCIYYTCLNLATVLLLAIPHLPYVGVAYVGVESLMHKHIMLFQFLQGQC